MRCYTRGLTYFGEENFHFEKKNESFSLRVNVIFSAIIMLFNLEGFV